ncbi:MAG: SulP family inorganic anion transporter [Bacteroidota bacterium]|nr:SulP family inorganic anion transporter [Bacteroidota bacterium]
MPSCKIAVCVKDDKEFFALGLADLVCGILRGFPVSGSSSRSAVNVLSGARQNSLLLWLH